MPRSQQSSGKKSIQIRPSSLPVGPVMNQRPPLGQTMKEGFAFGVGSSVANSLIRSFLGSPPSVQQIQPIDTTVQSARFIGASSTQDMSGQIEYLQCMKEGGTEEVCKQYMN
jgi:hypothetical protein